jgi:hypothetical protein
LFEAEKFQSFGLSFKYDQFSQLIVRYPLREFAQIPGIKGRKGKLVPPDRYYLFIIIDGYPDPFSCQQSATIVALEYRQFSNRGQLQATKLPSFARIKVAIRNSPYPLFLSRMNVIPGINSKI